MDPIQASILAKQYVEPSRWSVDAFCNLLSCSKDNGRAFFTWYCSFLQDGLHDSSFYIDTEDNEDSGYSFYGLDPCQVRYRSVASRAHDLLTSFISDCIQMSLQKGWVNPCDLGQLQQMLTNIATSQFACSQRSKRGRDDINDLSPKRVRLVS